MANGQHRSAACSFPTRTGFVRSRRDLAPSTSDKAVHTHSSLRVLAVAGMESRACGKFASKFLLASPCGQVLRQSASGVNSDPFPM